MASAPSRYLQMPALTVSLHKHKKFWNDISSYSGFQHSGILHRKIKANFFKAITQRLSLRKF
jgi:hypothetical protein